MNKRLIGVFAFALVIAGGASLILYRLLAKRIATQDTAASTKVIVAQRNLDIGTLIKEPDVRFADWSGQPPPGALTRLEEIVDRGVISAIYSGEPILESRLAPRGAGAGLASTIPVGMRAVAVRVNEVVGVAGFVIPGMRVDVLIMGQPPNQSAANLGTLSRTLLQNVEVLSAGQSIQKDAEGKPIPVPVVNLLVNPEQAEILSLASNDARIQLVLRNPLDKEEVKTPGTALGYLLTGASRPTALPAAGPGPRPRPRMAPPRPAPVVPAKAVEPEKEKPPVIVELILGSKSGAKKTEVKFEEKSQEQQEK